MNLTERQIEVLHLLNHPKAYARLNGGRFDVWTCVRPKKGIVDISKLDNVDIFLLRISIYTWGVLYDSGLLELKDHKHVIAEKGREYLMSLNNGEKYVK